MGDQAPFGSEPWMVVPSPNAWPAAKKAWNTTWNGVPAQQQKASSARLVAPPQQPPPSATPSSTTGADEILAPKLDGVTFVDNLNPNAWIAKPPTKGQKQDQTDEKVNIEDELSKQSLYKTEMCRSFMDTGNCRYGTKCQFAHGAHERRPVLRHPKYKTEICKKFSNTGNCPYGNRCRFIHPGITYQESDEEQSTWSDSWTPTGVSTVLPSPPTSPEKKQQILDASNEARRLAIFERIANA